jgi:hypothetical protein
MSQAEFVRSVGRTVERSSETNVELELNGETAALLAHAIHGQEDIAPIVAVPRWLSETLRHGTTQDLRTRAAARLLAAVHNPHRDGPITVRVWGEPPNLDGRITYSCGTASRELRVDVQPRDRLDRQLAME